MKFDGDKIAHEHIYWDQASLLVQIGLLDSKILPAYGKEQTRKILRYHHRKKEETRTTTIDHLYNRYKGKSSKNDYNSN